MKKWVLSLVVAAFLCTPTLATEWWLTADPTGVEMLNVVAQEGDTFSLYAFADPTTVSPIVELDYLEMWTGLTASGIAKFTDITIKTGVPMSSAIFPEEALYGATEMAMSEAGPFATLDFIAVGKGKTFTANMPVKSGPGGIGITFEPSILVVPEPTTITLALVGLIGISLLAIRRR